MDEWIIVTEAKGGTHLRRSREAKSRKSSTQRRACGHWRRRPRGWRVDARKVAVNLDQWLSPLARWWTLNPILVRVSAAVWGWSCQCSVQWRRGHADWRWVRTRWRCCCCSLRPHPRPSPETLACRQAHSLECGPRHAKAANSNLIWPHKQLITIQVYINTSSTTCNNKNYELVLVCLFCFVLFCFGSLPLTNTGLLSLTSWMMMLTVVLP